MNKAEEILDKHLELRNWTKTVPKHGNLYNTLLDVVNEALSIADVSVSVCSCEMPAKVKGKNECWRCKKPFKEFLQTER